MALRARNVGLILRLVCNHGADVWIALPGGMCALHRRSELDTLMARGTKSCLETPSGRSAFRPLHMAARIVATSHSFSDFSSMEQTSAFMPSYVDLSFAER